MAQETVVCTYRVRPESETEFVSLLARHGRVVRELGLVTGPPLATLRQADEPTYVEVFTWVEGGFGRAHEHPDVLAVWEPMDPLLEERDGHPKWEFPHFAPVEL
jgi:hypothetical protein